MINSCQIDNPTMLLGTVLTLLYLPMFYVRVKRRSRPALIEKG